MRMFKKIVTGILIAFGISSLISMIGLAVLLLVLRDGGESLPDRILLRVNLTERVRDQRPTKSILESKPKPNLRALVAGIRAAARDDRVDGLVVRLGNAQMGVAEIQELRDAIGDFREQDKFAHVFSEDLGGLGGGTGRYYLASAFDEIWLQPSGGVGLIGMAIQIPFARGVLDELEVEPRFGNRHEFKSGAEPFTRSALSDPARENLQALLNSLFDQIVAGVAERRGLEPSKVRTLVDNGPYLAAEAVQVGLVDKLGYFDEFIDDALELAEDDTEEVSIRRYLAGMEEPDDDAPQVALIYGTGTISNQDDTFGRSGFHARRIANRFAAAVEDEDIKAILFRVDSPGGSYIASDIVWREVSRAREAGKPVIVSMGRTAASGGYFVAMPATSIVAQPGTVTGSIGVYGGKFVSRKLWERLGVTWDGVHVGERATMWSFIDDFPPGAEDRFAAMLDFIYEDFTTKAMADRDLTAEQIDKVARGRVWSGREALEAGLVDRLGGYPAALDEIRKALELEAEDEINLVLWPKQLGFFERFMRTLKSGNIRTEIALLFGTQEVGGMDRLARELEPLVGDISAFTRPRGVLQMPPLSLRY